jgi:AraC-like DNA-binding protein
MAAAELRRLYEELERKAGRLVVPDAARLSRERRLALHAAEYLRRRTADRVAAAEVAAACHVSLSALSHVFKRVMGASLRAYLLKLRLERAKEAMRSGKSVTDAALEAGFDDPNYFSRAFAAAEGLPPSRWKEGNAGVRNSSV